MMTRRRMITSLGGLALAAVGVEAVALEPRRVCVTSHRIAGDTPNGPTLRVAQLTDLHLRRVGTLEERVIEKLADLDPDLVVFTGDSIDRANAIIPFGDFLSLLDRSTAKYAILGNWEHSSRVDLGRLKDLYQSFNCRLLVNESVSHDHDGARLLITGLDDLIRGRPDPAAALLGAEAAPNHLLLAHCPQHRDVLGFTPGAHGVAEVARTAGERTSELHERFRPDIMLAGHTHGGQVALFGFAPVRPRGAGRYIAGWYRDVAPAMYVSRGLGWTALPVRFGAAPEIPLFEWTLAPT